MSLGDCLSVMSSLIVSDSSVCSSIPWWGSCPCQKSTYQRYLFPWSFVPFFEGYGWAHMSPEKAIPSWSCHFFCLLSFALACTTVHATTMLILVCLILSLILHLNVMRSDSCHSPLIGRLYACSRGRFESRIRASLLRLNACFLPPPMAGWDACFSRGGFALVLL